MSGVFFTETHFWVMIALYLYILPGRLAVGPMPLEHGTGVRIPARQQSCESDRDGLTEPYFEKSVAKYRFVS